MPYGMVRRVKDIQEDVNKRASKALFILSTNKVVMDEGAVDDIDELAEEVARPDGIIVKKPGKALEIRTDRELSQYQLDLMSRSIGMIQQSSGVTDELLGRRTNATSGIAIERRQDQGSMTTTSLFDNLRFAQQVRGEKQVSLIEQFMDERKAFRITNMRGQPEYVEVNDGLPENDIVRSKADFVISESDWRSTLRQSAVEALLEAATRWPPEIVMVMLDLLVENMDLPNRDEIVRRIRSVTGQRDPDAEEPSEEEQAQMQAKAAIPANGARMTRQVEDNCLTAVRQLEWFEALSSTVRDGLIQARFGHAVENVQWASGVLSRSSFGTVRAWQAMDGRGAVNLVLLTEVVRRLAIGPPVDLTEFPGLAGAVMTEVVDEVVQGWDEDALDVFGTQVGFPLLRLDHEALVRRQLALVDGN